MVMMMTLVVKVIVGDVDECWQWWRGVKPVDLPFYVLLLVLRLNNLTPIFWEKCNLNSSGRGFGGGCLGPSKLMLTCYVCEQPIKRIKILKIIIRRCDKLLFMSTEADDDLGAVALPNIASGRASLWNKTRKVKMILFVSFHTFLFRRLPMCGKTTERMLTGS